MFSGQLPFRFVPCNLKNLCYNGVIILGGATMRIDQLDENLRIDTEIAEPDLVWMDALRAPFALYGVFYDEEKGCYLRMPDAVANCRWKNTFSDGFGLHCYPGRNGK